MDSSEGVPGVLLTRVAADRVVTVFRRGTGGECSAGMDRDKLQLQANRQTCSGLLGAVQYNATVSNSNKQSTHCAAFRQRWYVAATCTHTVFSGTVRSSHTRRQWTRMYTGCMSPRHKTFEPWRLSYTSFTLKQGLSRWNGSSAAPSHSI
jgi:hypothetical protein